MRVTGGYWHDGYLRYLRYLQRIEGRLESAELVGADAFVQLDALGENEGDLKLAAWQQPRVQSRKRFGVT